jgi:hypothetical protein
MAFVEGAPATGKRNSLQSRRGDGLLSTGDRRSARAIIYLSHGERNATFPKPGLIFPECFADG